ncbi:MAG: M28 family peptidase [Bacteroidetes bacterium]|nr:M28 family peptidase [Bacteroidota bacterium]
MNFRQYIFIPLFLLLIASSCNMFNQKKTTSESEEKKPEAPVTIPSFNADSAYQYVKKQVDFGPRVCNTKAHEKCGDFLEKKLREFCPNVIVQKGQVKAYNGTMLNFKNYVASFNPETNNRIFLCSHWDSRPWADHDPDPAKHNTPIDGANDGASGVGILLEVARQLSISKPLIGVDIIFLDAEDYGPPEDKKQEEETTDWWALGAQYWAKNPHKANYFAKYGILLDMVGAPNATFLQEGFSMNYAPAVVKSVWSTGLKLGYSDYFIFEEGGTITDDHVPINKILSIPTIDIIHLDRNSKTGFYPYWHTTKDDINSIDRTTLKVVGTTLLKVIETEQ